MTFSSLNTNKLQPQSRVPFASVSSTTGTVNTGSFTDSQGTWTFYRFTSSGTITFGNSAPGYAQMLAVGGGGSAGATDGSGYASGGGGGGANIGEFFTSAGTYTVTVGAAGGYSWIGTSAVAAFVSGGAGTGGGGGRPSTPGYSGGGYPGGNGTNSGGGGGTRGVGGDGSGGAGGAGLTSSITGTAVEYGKGGGGSNGVYGGVEYTGGGASNSGASQGAKTGRAGCVIVRVRTA